MEGYELDAHLIISWPSPDFRVTLSMSLEPLSDPSCETHYLVSQKDCKEPQITVLVHTESPAGADACIGWGGESIFPGQVLSGTHIVNGFEAIR